ncbi:hypothetical protein DFH09DRAFT_894391, partial [Mycena vulgaris]
KSRNLVVSIDGTSNQFGPYNTNVVELHSRIIKDSDDPSKKTQLTFYLSGIGTYVPPSLWSFAYWKQLIANNVDLAIAWNFKQHVQDAYRWLTDHYQPGDTIFLFGFSRGAYQVRALAGMIATVGQQSYTVVSLTCEFSDGSPVGSEEATALCTHFKTTFSRDVSVHFVGAWDTVSSVGIFRGQPLPLTTSADHLCHFRHALALDERRVRFLPEYVNGSDSQTRENRPDTPIEPTMQPPVWFSGTHSDILDLAGVPLLWMENEATSAGLYLEPRDTGGWNWDALKSDRPNESLTGLFWWFLEKLPLTRSTYNVRKPEETTCWPPHNGTGRVILPGQLIHASVAFKGKTYEPRASISNSLFTWESLIDKGSLSDIGWAQAWESHLEMDLFDPSLAGDI